MGDARDALVEFLVRNGAAGFFELVHAAVVEKQDFAQMRVGDVLEEHTVVVGLAKGDDRAGVFDDPLHLLERTGRVDRCGGQPGGHDGEVSDRPLVARAGEQRDAVALLGTESNETLGRFTDLRDELGGGHVHPLVGFGLGEQDNVRPLLSISY